jgi:hypothetical protein
MNNQEQNECVFEYNKDTIEGKLKSGCIMHLLREGYNETSVEEIEEMYPLIGEFIKKTQWWHVHNTKVVCFKNNAGLLKLFLYTHTYEYAITITGNNFISVGYNCRKVRPLEDWNRGGDLIDGYYSKETMEGIVYAILRNEILSICKPKEE